MRSKVFVAGAATSIALVAAGSARAQDADVNDYDEEGVVEVGGSIGFDWTEDLLILGISPSIGWFVADHVELSVLTRIDYQRVDEGDSSASSKRGSIVFEPSFHWPINQESVFAFGGLGVGAGYDGDNPDFELVPRVGLNIEIGRAGVLTPAIRIPLLFGKNQGIDDEDFGVEPGFSFELGVTTTL